MTFLMWTSRYPLEPIPTARLAYYALALKSICKDPRDYYGHNLIGKCHHCFNESHLKSLIIIVIHSL